MIANSTKSVLLTMVLIVFYFSSASSQTTTISGNIKDGGTDEGLPGANITVKGKVVGTISDPNGDFNLQVKSTPPFTLEISFIGFKTDVLEITEGTTTGVSISLEEEMFLGQEIVVSASRVQESILKSPVSVEKMDIIAIRNTPAPTFYDAIANLKGVDMSAQSITYKSVNSRGFQANGNERFVQLIDGVDNQAPGLNFPVGNVVGISDIDLESVELIPGPASALYGPNALNGILVMKGKSPFEYQGLSVQSKMGINHTDKRDDDLSVYHDYQLRYAKAFKNKFAFKVNASILRADDFIAVDLRDNSDIEGGSTRENNIAYDGVNVYGEIPIDLSAFGLGVFTTTGFSEADMIDNNATSIKLGTALHYRLTDEFELIGHWTYGTGKTVLTATDRFFLDNFQIWTGRLELKGANFFVRAYTTQEDSGDTYGANTVASLINVHDGYIDNYITGSGGLFAALGGGATPTEAHALARDFADGLQSKPGSARFQHLFDSLRAIPISDGGAKFLDKTKLWHGEVMYNFAGKIDFADIIAGGNVRKYGLDSEGTLFALDDDNEEFSITEFGGYAQITKNLFNDKMRLSTSMRYDKNEYFKGQISPRFSSVYTIADKHNIRISFQRGFRMPTTQDQFIDLDVVARRLVGSSPILVDRYHFKTNTVYYAQSVLEARAANDVNLLEPVTIKEFETEKISSFEIGYKSLLGDKLLIDGYYYFSSYQDFIATIFFSQYLPSGTYPDSGPTDAQALVNDVTNTNTQEFGFDINAEGNVKSQGVALGLEFSLPRGYKIKSNISFNELLDEQDLVDQGFSAQYNTPKVRYNIGLRNRNLVQDLAFGITYRWQDSYFWESSYGNATVPEFGTLDLQFSYELHNLHSIIKLGGSNIFNKRYTTSFANPSIGAIYYLSITFDEFFN